MLLQNDQLLLNELQKYISEQRINLFNQIIQNRTTHFTVVLEDIYQSHNASAVLRTCDCLGIQNVHIIENRNSYQINEDIALGAEKWLSLHTYKEPNAVENCFKNLKNQGYTIAATKLSKEAKKITKYNIHQKTAFVFGTELHGITTEVEKHADTFLYIPMYGFTESFNVSVSAGILLFYLHEKLLTETEKWKLSEEEKIKIMLEWCRKTVKTSNIIEKEFLKKHQSL